MYRHTIFFPLRISRCFYLVPIGMRNKIKEKRTNNNLSQQSVSMCTYELLLFYKI